MNINLPAPLNITCLHELERIDEIDYLDGLHRSGEDVELYIRLLSKFSRDFRDVGLKINIYISALQWTDACRVTHTLQGILGFLGMKKLQKNAETLENLCAIASPSATSDLSVLQSKLESLFADLQMVLPGLINLCGAERNLEPYSEVDSTVVNELLRLLKFGENSAVELWSSRREGFAAYLQPPLYAAVDVALDIFDFDAAWTLLSSTTLPINLEK